MLGQTAGGCVGQLVDNFEVTRHLERGQLLGRVGAEDADVEGAPGGGNDERLHLLFRQLRRHADHRGFGDVGMALECSLDLRRRQVLATATEHLLLASDERVRVVGVGGDEVAGAEPTVVHHRRGFVGHLVVAAHDHRIAQLELAGTSDAHVGAFVVEDPRVVHVTELRMLTHRPERAERTRAVRPDQPVRRLRERVPAHDLDPETRLHLLLALALGRRARVAEPQRIVGVVGALRLTHEDLEHRADRVELGGLERAGRVEEATRGEPGQKGEARTGRDRSERRVRGRVDVEQRQRRHEPVVSGELASSTGSPRRPSRRRDASASRASSVRWYPT